MEMFCSNTLQNMQGGLWHLYDAQLVLRGPKRARKYPHPITPSPPPWTIDSWQDGSMLSCCFHQVLTLPSHCRTRNGDSSDQATFFNLLFSSFGEPVWIVDFVYCSQLTGVIAVWFSAAVVHLLQGWPCCVFRNALVHASVVTSGYLTWWLPLPFYQLEPVWPFFSDLWHQYFHSQNCPSLDIFSTILWLCMKIPIDQHFLKNSNHQQLCHIQSHVNHLSSPF